MSGPLRLRTGQDDGSRSDPSAAHGPAKPDVLATVRVATVVLLLLAAGGALYAGFVKDVFDRGNKIVDVSIKSKEARAPLQLGVSALACFAASGLTSFARPLRGRRLSPLLGIGLPLVPAGLVGLTAFSLGRTSFLLALVVLAPSMLTMLVACAVPPKPRPGLGRFFLRSWMATGFLVGLLLLALAGLEIAEKARPRVPWASVFAALAIGTLVQLAARYVGMHGNRPAAVAVDHVQVREVHDNDAIRAVAASLHPFIEEGRDSAAYALLAKDLGTVGRQAPASPPELPSGPPALPVAQAGTVAVLRAAAFAVPLFVIVPILGGPASVTGFGLALPFARKSLNPRQDPTPRSWWLAGALLMGLGGAWAGSQLQAPGFERLTWPFAGTLATPYAILFLTTLHRRVLPGHIAFLRLEHARALGKAWTKQVARGLVLAAASLGLPAVVWAASAATGLRIHAIAWPVLVGIAAAGALWALGALLCGPAAAGHRARLASEHAARVQARATAHRTFLDRLEMT